MNPFFSTPTPISLGALAEATGCELVVDGQATGDDALLKQQMHNVAPLSTAGTADVSFIDNVKYLGQFETSKAGACFADPKHQARAPKGMVLLLSDEPYAAYAKAAQLFYPQAPVEGNIASSAVIHADATIGEGCRIEAGAVIEAGALIGTDCIIGANAVIHEGVQIGDRSRIGACSTISHAIIGSDCLIHRGVHIGQDGFGFAPSKTGVFKVPQLGQVIIGNHVEIGSGTCIDRGSGPDTTIGDYTKIDNLVQIGHNVRVGKYCFLAGAVGLAGSCTIGDGVMLGGQSGVAGHLTVGDGARLAGHSATMVDIPAGETYVGAPAMPHREFFKQTARLKRLAKPS